MVTIICGSTKVCTLTISINILKYKDKGQRDDAVFEDHIRYGYTLREIPDHLRVRYATVSRAIKRAEKMR